MICVHVQQMKIPSRSYTVYKYSKTDDTQQISHILYYTNTVQQIQGKYSRSNTVLYIYVKLYTLVGNIPALAACCRSIVKPSVVS